MPAKVGMEIKKLTATSPSEVRLRAANDDFIFLCDYVDEDDLALINKMERMLEGNGIETRLFEDGIETTSELFNNLEDPNRSIDEECDLYPDQQNGDGSGFQEPSPSSLPAAGKHSGGGSNWQE